MSLKIVLLIATIVGIGGVALGYYLRLIISLGKRGSMELEIKKMQVDAEEAAKKVVFEAEEKAAGIMKELRQEIKEKEEKAKAIEERLIKKQDSHEKRQADLDSEVE